MSSGIETIETPKRLSLTPKTKKAVYRDDVSKLSVSDAVKNHQLLFHPNHLEVNYNILQAKFLYTPQLNELQYPFVMDLMSLSHYYEHYAKVKKRRK